MLERFGQETGETVAESDDRLGEERRQAEHERLREEDHVRLSEIEIQPLHRVLKAPDRNAYD